MKIGRILLRGAGTVTVLALASSARADLTGFAWYVDNGSTAVSGTFAGPGVPTGGATTLDAVFTIPTGAGLNFNQDAGNDSLNSFLLTGLSSANINILNANLASSIAISSGTATNPGTAPGCTGTCWGHILEITGTIEVAPGTYTISADDGIFLSLVGVTVANTVIINSPFPEAETPYTVAIGAGQGGIYNLTMSYGECCGNPSVLSVPQALTRTVAAVPEPMSMSLLGACLALLGVARWRSSLKK